MINLTEKRVNNFKKRTIIISAVLLITSLTQTAFYVGQTKAPENVDALFAFLFGWVVFLGSGISWLANPFLILSWFLIFKKEKYSRYCSSIAVLLSISFLLLNSVVTNEGGVPRDVVSYGIGYWLWLSSCVANCVGIILITTSFAKSPKVLSN